MTTNRPLTPDFYSYRWAPLIEASLVDGWVTVSWEDGTQLRCYALWLAENAPGVGIEPQSRESMIEPGQLPDPRDLLGAKVDADGGLALTWRDGTESGIHPGWLRHRAEGQYAPQAYLPATVQWTSRDFTEPPSFDGSQVIADPSELTAWLEAMVSYGVARLRNTPADKDYLAELATYIGPVRGSNFGGIFSVQAVVEPDSTANTTLNLGQHTDLPTWETPPGFQFLHCVENEVEGGWSRMTDGSVVVDHLRETYPEDYEALTTLEWVFFNRSPDADHRWQGPLIDHPNDGYPLTLRAFYPVRGFPAMPESDVPRAYAALRRFSQVAHDPQFQIRYPFEPGDLVGFDNRRTLHGRDEFASNGQGKRYLRGCYIDRDDVLSRLRVLNKQGQLL